MQYKRPVHNQSKFFPPFYTPKPSYSMNSPEPAPRNDFFGIPLPNELESMPAHDPAKRKAPIPVRIAAFIREHIKIEEIILIGLIILMLDESIEDDLLLIILIYILLF